MNSVLQRYEQQATILRKRGTVISDVDVRRDMQLIGNEPVENWKGVQRRLDEAGHPTALAGGFTGLEVTPPVATLATATILTTEVAFWPVATWTPIAANPQCPKAYKLIAYGTSTTAATQGTMAFNARFGQIVTSPLIGASTTAAQTASQTATPWRLDGDVTIRAGGGATTGLVVASFKYEQGTATSGGSAVLSVVEQVFGTTTGAVSVVTDGSTAAGLWIGGIAVTSTTNTYITQSIVWGSWN